MGRGLDQLGPARHVAAAWRRPGAGRGVKEQQIMTIETNKALVRRAIGYNHGAADRGAEIFASDRSEEHTSELQSQSNLVCRLLLEKKKKKERLRKHATNLA